MSKFNVGDRVRYTGPVKIVRIWKSQRPKKLRPGIIGTVLETDSGFPFVSWDSITCGYRGYGKDLIDTSQWAVLSNELELI